MSASLRLAFLGDIHGNLPALEAVLEDLDQQAPDAVFLLGDLINRCPWTRELLDVLRLRDWPSVQGNHDLVLARLKTPEGAPEFKDRNRFPNVHWTWEKLHSEDLLYLLHLPHDLLIEIEGAPALRLFHGLPDNPFVGILPQDDEQLTSSRIALFNEPILICGHTHQPMDRTVPSSLSEGDREAAQVPQQRILNPGSVGMPYNSDPRAQYLILDLVQKDGIEEWQPMFRRIDYDFERVATAFSSSGLLESSGAVAKLNLRTIRDGQPWVSDFQQWLRKQPKATRSNAEAAVDQYLEFHGPDKWAFGT